MLIPPRAPSVEYFDSFFENVQGSAALSASTFCILLRPVYSHTCVKQRNASIRTLIQNATSLDCLVMSQVRSCTSCTLNSNSASDQTFLEKTKSFIWHLVRSRPSSISSIFIQKISCLSSCQDLNGPCLIQPQEVLRAVSWRGIGMKL